MVAGDTREPPPDPKGGGGGAADAEVVPERSNGFAASGVTPVVREDDDFDEVSNLRASSADDAALMANSMTGLRQMPRSAAFISTSINQQAPCHSEKPNKIWVFVLRTVRPPRQLMPLRQIFPPIERVRAMRRTARTTLRIAESAQYLSSWRRNRSPPKHFPREQISATYRHP
jgi:hypothetical protein